MKKILWGVIALLILIYVSTFFIDNESSFFPLILRGGEVVLIIAAIVWVITINGKQKTINDTSSQGVEISEQEKQNHQSGNSDLYWGCLFPFILLLLVFIILEVKYHSDLGLVLLLIVCGPIIAIVWIIWFIIVRRWTNKSNRK